MKRLSFAIVALATMLCACSKKQETTTSTQLPYLEKKGTTSQLMVNGKPFIIRGGELANSSASSTKFMRKNVWPVVKKMNLNTVLAPVYWELIEPEEGKFDFRLVEDIINDARRNNMKLVFLWFGAWKNSMSCYAPAWVKTDVERFPRALAQNGQQQEIVTPFSENLYKADEKAFTQLLKKIKEFDGQQNTVIMVQVENEIAMLPSARDYSQLAEKEFTNTVPALLTNYLSTHKAHLTPHLSQYWNGETNGTWSELFGTTIYGEEIFQAWFYATYVNRLVEAGKAVYNIPMYVNAALNRAGRLPGEYPSAGPIPNLIDIWKAGAPAVDMLSPDIYFDEFVYWTTPYYRDDNAVFIPEHQFNSTVGAKSLYAYGKLHALGFSPFSIENPTHIDNPAEEPIAKTYAIIKQIEPLLNQYRGSKKMTAVLLDKTTPTDTLTLGKYQIVAKHYNTLSWAPMKNAENWEMGGAIIFATAENEYIVAGTGVVLTFATLDKEKRAGILSVDEISYKNGKEVLGRRLNGDEDHQGRHLSISDGSWEIQKIKLYPY